MAYIGLDIGGTKILGALLDDEGAILDKEKTASLAEEGFDTFLSQVHHVIDTLFERTSEPIAGIGVGVPGMVDQQGVVVFTPNLPMKKFDLTSHLKERYHTNVQLGNDVNLGTYGEYKELKIQHKNVIGFFPGTGLGGGIIINGRLYIGKGLAGELGHIVVNKNGVPCSCGNEGCLESYASKKGIIAYLQSQLDHGRDTVLRDAVETGVIKSSKLKKAVDQGDVLAVEAIEQFKEYLGMGVGMIMNIFNPDLILIGGGIIDAFGEEMLIDIKKHAKHHAMKGIYKRTEIRQSRLGDDAVIYGAFHLVRD